MSKEISKSPDMLQKEATILSLQAQLKKTRSTLKGLKTRLSNTQKEITDIQMKTSGQYIGLMDKLDNLRQDIVAILKRLIKLKNLIPEEKRQLEMLVDDMGESSFGEEFEKYKANREKKENGDFDFDENQRAKMRDLFKEFRVEPDEVEQRNIRKTFIKLSSHFHPDKAKTKEEGELFHVMMQEINEAYQQGDIDRLLEIERLNLDTETLDFHSKAITVDILQQEINRLEKELAHLKNQIERTRIEIKQLRKSDLGKLLTDINKANRKGEGMDVAIQEMEAYLEQLTMMKNGLVKAEQDGNLTAFYKEMMSNMDDENIFDQFGIDDGEGIDMIEAMRGLFEEGLLEDEQIENPKFKIGSSVRFKNNLFTDDQSKDFTPWEGRIINTFYDMEGEEVYVVEFDSVSINQFMSAEHLANTFNFGMDFSEFEAHPNDIETTLPRDTEEMTLAAYRKVFHSYNWSALEKQEQKLMLKIMMQIPEKSDQENWMYYFENNWDFPSVAWSRGMFTIKKNKKTDLVGLYQWDHFGGLLALVKKSGKFVTDHPIVDFYIKNKSEQKLALDVYKKWCDEFLLF